MDAMNDNEQLPRTRAEAASLGIKHYFTGQPCKRGHMEKRLTSSGQCKECARTLQRAAYPKRIEKILSYQSEYRDRNREKIRAYAKEWRKKNPEKFLIAIERWRDENPDYRSGNLEHFRKKDKEYQARRRSTPKGRIDDAISAGIRDTLKRGQKRGTRWEMLVGYSVDELMMHLEKRFEPGMSWDNYGEWHMDHRIPKTAFNYETVDDIDFKRCWALENLRPMWAKENMRKGAKLDAPFQPSLLIATNDNKKNITPQETTNG